MPCLCNSANFVQTDLSKCSNHISHCHSLLHTRGSSRPASMKPLALSVFSERQRFAELLRHCSKYLLFDQGVQLHAAIVTMGFEIDLMLSNDLIDLYGKCGKVNVARPVFDRMLQRNVVSWTALMRGYVQMGSAKQSLILFSQMGLSGVKPNDFTLSLNLKACSMLNDPCIGMQFHGICVKNHFDAVTVVGNSIIDMYSKCGRINEAACVFETMPVQNLVSWNSMIAGYTLAGQGEKALVLFREMREHGEDPDEVTLSSTLKACSAIGAIREGMKIHAFVITNGYPNADKSTVSGALVDFYVKCSKLSKAQKVFSHFKQKHVISWSSLILGYAQEGNFAESVKLFRLLRETDIQVDGFILSSMMGIFADFALVEQGKQMHGYAIKVPSGLDISVGNAIVDMYLKCGVIEEAENFFSEMPTKNVISWTVMITGYGKHGLGREAIHLFNKMQLHGIEPDDVTYLAILLACSHSGLVESGQIYFSKLKEECRIKARVEHYACMVDLLGRAGRLKEAKELIDGMPLRPNVGVWQTLLSACRVHGDLELGREVCDVLLKLDSNNPATFVTMSNMFAEAGYWNECERIRELAETKRLKKEAGCSWIEIDKEIHYFYGGDDKHPLMEKIHGILKETERKMKEQVGYIHGVKYALHDVEEESKEESLRVHSEKLAIGLGLLCVGREEEGRLIRVFKNLRVCGDCHEFIKGLSKISKLAFVVRDASRFHKFQDGVCSCGDYW